MYICVSRKWLDDVMNTYPNSSFPAGYIYCRLCEASRALLATLIPYRYVVGRDHGRIEGNCWLWDFRLDAGEDTAILEELQRRVWTYEEGRLDALLTQWDADTHSRGCPPEELEAAISEEKIMLTRFVEAQHADVLRHHDLRAFCFREWRRVSL
jgi:hypothetical protein